MGKKFSRLPTWWIRDPQGSQLKELKTSEVGKSIAAMKCLLSMATVVDFHTRQAKIGYSDLEDVAGLSRPTLTQAIAKLEELKIISVDRGGYSNTYELTVTPDDDRWAKVPTDRVKKNLKTISNRGVAPLAGLKIYLTMLSLRQNSTNKIQLTHATLRDYTGIQTTHVRKGLDVLFDTSLIHIQQADGRGCNEYTLLGIDT